MISLQQIQLPITHSDKELQEKIAELLGLDFEEVKKHHKEIMNFDIDASARKEGET